MRLVGLSGMGVMHNKLLWKTEDKGYGAMCEVRVGQEKVCG